MTAFMCIIIKYCCFEKVFQYVCPSLYATFGIPSSLNGLIQLFQSDLQVYPYGYLILYKTLEHFKFICIEPCKIAEVASVDFYQIGKAIKCPEHRILAFWTGYKMFRFYISVF